MRSVTSIILLFLAPPVWATCLQVSEHSIDVGDVEVGASTVEWSALIENRCERGYDADLTVQFMDNDGAVLYEVRDYVILDRLGSVQVGNSVYVPSAYIEGITQLNIELEERERPF